jgi:adenine-specific DNA-methyltransferase
VKTFLSEVKAGKTPGSLWKYDEVGHTHLANEQLAGLLGKGAFDNPKPVGLIKRCLQLSTNDSDLILDFFSGSCTTAQAVLELNREDGSNRQFIMVQLPEPTGKTDYATIADIGKERIRRVIAKMQKENAGKMDLHERATPEDLGFKVFKLAPSNYKQWNVDAGGSPAPKPTPEEYATQAAMFLDPLVDGWQLENVIYEVALKEGYGLNCHVERVASMTDATIYRVADPDQEQAFYICLDDSLRLDALKPLDLHRDDLFVCRDRALDDEAAANLVLQCRLKVI